MRVARIRIAARCLMAMLVRFSLAERRFANSMEDQLERHERLGNVKRSPSHLDDFEGLRIRRDGPRDDERFRPRQPVEESRRCTAEKGCEPSSIKPVALNSSSVLSPDTLDTVHHAESLDRALQGVECFATGSNVDVMSCTGACGRFQDLIVATYFEGNERITKCSVPSCGLLNVECLGPELSLCSACDSSLRGDNASNIQGLPDGCRGGLLASNFEFECDNYCGFHDTFAVNIDSADERPPLCAMKGCAGLAYDCAALTNNKTWFGEMFPTSKICGVPCPSRGGEPFPVLNGAPGISRAVHTGTSGLASILSVCGVTLLQYFSL